LQSGESPHLLALLELVYGELKFIPLVSQVLILDI
jgi:hypothetical protein